MPASAKTTAFPPAVCVTPAERTPFVENLTPAAAATVCRPSLKTYPYSAVGSGAGAGAGTELTTRVTVLETIQAGDRAHRENRAYSLRRRRLSETLKLGKTGKIFIHK
ncbi:MAG: hypothetical protein ACLR06_00850 [Christensenellaceae bacterium]